MRAASEQGREAAVVEGVAIAREAIARLRPHVQGLAVNAPFGRAATALQVFEGLLEGNQG